MARGWDAAFGDYGDTSANKGYHAFLICNEMTKHRLWLQEQAFNSDQFEEKEVSYPAGDGADYRMPWDYIRIPESKFTDAAASGDWISPFGTFRHEFSHGLMSDEYWCILEAAGKHNYDTPCDTLEGAWSEAWADFLPQPSLLADYGVTKHDQETSPGNQLPYTATPDNARIEGEIAGAMWDIYDPVGWEKRSHQIPAIPGDEMFYDGIEDPQLSKIKSIFSADHPMSFTDGTFAGGPDSFIHYWLGRSDYDELKHALKAIVLNRDILSSHFTQHAPQITVGAPTWDKCTVKLPFTVTDVDPEDRGHVWAELSNEAGLTQRQLLKDGWNGSTRAGVFEQGIAWQTGFPQPVLYAAANDDMDSGWAKRALDVPAGSVAGGLMVKVTKLVMRREPVNDDPKWEPDFWPSNVEWLRSVWAKTTVSEGKVASPRVTQIVNTGQVYVAERSKDILKADGWIGETGEVYKQQILGDYLEVRIEGGFRQDGAPQTTPQVLVERFTRDQNYGIGTHTVIVADHTIPSAMLPGLSLRGVMELTYEVVPVRPVAQGPNIPQPQISTGGPPSGPLSIAQPNLQGATTQPPISALQPLTFSRLLSRASRLADEYAHLQGLLHEASQVMEYRLGPRQSPPAAATSVTPGLTLSSPTTQAAQLAQVEVAPLQLRDLKPSSFLQRAAAGRVKLAVLTPEQRTQMEAVNAAVADAEQRLGTIQTESAGLQQQIAAGITRLGTARGLSAADLTRARALLTAADGRLAQVKTDAVKSRAFASVERQVLGKALK